MQRHASRSVTYGVGISFLQEIKSPKVVARIKRERASLDSSGIFPRAFHVSREISLNGGLCEGNCVAAASLAFRILRVHSDEIKRDGQG